jgi:hypothetical protein
MDETERRKILDEAYSTLDRLNTVRPSEPRSATAPDVLEEWKRNMPRPEPKPRERGLDTSPVDWNVIINQRVASMKDFVITVLGEALKETFEIERGAYQDALSKRDQRIGQLECELLRVRADLERLNLRVIKNEVDGHDKVIDLPALPKRPDKFN